MITVKVKICGITNFEDAQAAVNMGADILGFNFYEKSPRYITPEKAREIIIKLPSYIDIAGIFVNTTKQQIHRLTDQGLLNWVQFHGDETPEFCNQFNYWGLNTMKAIRVRSAEDIAQAKVFRTHSILFDSFNPDLYGGTGKAFDWELIKECPRRIFLAGGIGPDNVAEALKVDVYAVDVCSGIESEPGKKDLNKMKQLFEAIHDHIGLKVHK